jgi:hypothetical protein
MVDTMKVSLSVTPRAWVKLILWLSRKRSPLVYLFYWVATDWGATFAARHGFKVSIAGRGH